MKRVQFEKNSDEWLQWRKGKITGSKLKDIYQTSTPAKQDILDELDALAIEHKKTWTIGVLMDLLPLESQLKLKDKVSKKLGYYELIAERLTVEHESDDEEPMQRGHTLEQQALNLFEEYTGYKVNGDCGAWVSEDNEHIAISPDGEIDETHAVEVKCLSSAKHLQAFFEQTIPSEYESQVAQYFVVNDKLDQLYFVFYDPRIPAKPLHYITVDRSEVAGQVAEYKRYQQEVLKEIEAKINQLTF